MNNITCVYKDGEYIWQGTIPNNDGTFTPVEVRVGIQAIQRMGHLAKRNKTGRATDGVARAKVIKSSTRVKNA